MMKNWENYTHVHASVHSHNPRLLV